MSRALCVIIFITVSVSYCVPANPERVLPGTKCKTPNGEDATCISLYSCKPIIDAIQSKVKRALEFSQQSHCHPSGSILVCCGNHGTFMEDNTTPNNEVKVINKRDLLANVALCGIQAKDDRFEQRKFTQIDEYPWMAILFYESELDKSVIPKCAGSLISDRYVLTAAQCLRQRYFKLKFVRLGEYDTSSTGVDCVKKSREYDECTEPSIDVEIEEVIVHENYVYSMSNDIGLIRLIKHVSYSDFIRPICIPDDEKGFWSIGSEMITSGWGSVVHNEKATNVKKNQSTLVADFKECNKVWKNEKVDGNKFICLKHTIDGPCSGDSGGPMMSVKNFRWHQNGIVAAGFKGCEKGSVTWGPRIDQYVDWIVNNLRK